MTLNKAAQIETAAQGPNKHIVIQGRLASLESAVSGLEELIAHVAGEPTTPETETKRAEYALSEFLDATPGQINAITERLQKGTARLKELLF